MISKLVRSDIHLRYIFLRLQNYPPDSYLGVTKAGGKEMSGENNSKGNSRSNTPAPLANNIKTEENGETSGK